MYLPQEERDANETADAIRAEGRRALLLPGDVTDFRYCEECIARTVNECGSLDILVNNAAFQKNQESIDDIDLEQLERTFRTNFFGYFYLAKAAVPRMKKGACMINTGSVTGLEGGKTLLDYSATKGASFWRRTSTRATSRGKYFRCLEGKRSRGDARTRSPCVWQSYEKKY